jgi:ketosteroid isomerase-like protein
MSTALDVTKRAYEAFGRGDIPAFLKLVADEVDWKLVDPASWPPKIVSGSSGFRPCQPLRVAANVLWQEWAV